MKRSTVMKMYALLMTLLLAFTSFSVPVDVYAAVAKDEQLTQGESVANYDDYDDFGYDEEYDEDEEYYIEDDAMLLDSGDVKTIPDTSGTLPGGAKYEIIGLNNFETSEVTDMSYMFSG